MLSLRIGLIAVNCVALAAAVHYKEHWDLTYKYTDLSGDDEEKAFPVFLLNGEYVGPTLVGNVGDTWEIKVTNHLNTDQSASVHWHGVSDISPWYDGSPVVSCPIVKGSSFTYKFECTEAKTAWYHSHVETRAKGAYGLIICNDPNSPLTSMYSEDRTLAVQEWHDASSADIISGLSNLPFRWPGNGQNMLWNGKFKNSISVTSGKTYRLRIGNFAAMAYFNFAIAGHKLTVIASDGLALQPFEVTSVDIASGQILDVLLTTDQPVATYSMGLTTNWRGNDTSLSGVNFGGSLVYEGSTEESTARPEHNSYGFDEWLPRFKAGPGIAAPPAAAKYIIKTESLQQFVDAEGVGLGKTQTPEAKALAWTAYQNRRFEHAATPAQYSAYFTDSYTPAPTTITLAVGDVVDVIFENNVNTGGTCETHPWHLHGVDFWVMGQGAGEWDENTSPQTYSAEPYKTTVVGGYPSEHGHQRGVHAEKGEWSEKCGWVAVRFVASLPGSWFAHCHISFHAVMGMGFNFDVDPRNAPAPPSDLVMCGDIPSQVCASGVYDSCCEAWDGEGSLADHCPAQVDDGNGCICGIDPFSCTTGWDAQSILIATNACGLRC